MKTSKLHLIVKYVDGKLMGIINPKGEKGVYWSSCWKFSEEEAKKILDGKILFHQKKADRSSMGGKVVKYVYFKTGGPDTEYYQPISKPFINGEPQPNTREWDEANPQLRVAFKFKMINEYRNKMWEGRNDARAWTSGVIEDSPLLKGV